tara:strand:+ start:71 stop:667 length:597 start_codon:yes stop_codon:yes gene_type:complete
LFLSLTIIQQIYDLIILIIYLSFFYFVFGFLYLIVPLIAIELSRPKDLIKGGLMILLGIFFIIKQNIFNSSFLIIFILNIILLGFFVIEVFLNRWNQLSDNEKMRFKNISELSKKLLIFLDVLNLLFNKSILKFKEINSDKKYLPEKKWVRTIVNSKNEKSSKDLLDSNTLKIQSTNNSKEDIIVDDSSKSKSKQNDI